MFTIIDSEKCFSGSVPPYYLIKGEFDVCQPYFRVKREDVTTKEGPAIKKRKRNKQKTESTQSVTDLETQKRHELLRPTLLLCIEQLTENWPSRWIETTVPNQNLSIPSDPIDFPSIQHMVETAQNKFSEADEDEEPILFKLDSHVTKELDIFSIFNLVCINESLETRLLHITPEATYLIPPNSAFLMGSINNSLNQLGSYVRSIGGADIIVMDPPWPNKSVHRSSHYETQDIYDLYSIPIEQMMASKDSIVAIWVTNKPKFRNFIINKLFPSWKLECVSEWVWLKTTTQAEPIFPIDSEHKKPYEQLIIGRPIQYTANRQTRPLPKTHVIVSIPSKRHSRKPPLQDVFFPYIDNIKDPVCVELFARCLSAGWISWGNECLKFQHSSYFEKKDKQE